MKKHLSSRLLSLFLVVVLCAGFAVPAGAAGTQTGDSQKLTFEKTEETVAPKLGASMDTSSEDDSENQYAANDTVRVSIVLEDASTIEKFGTEDVATNASAKAYRASLKNTQARMTEEIDSAINGSIDVVWNLTLAANIISANVRYDQIDAIRGVEGVKNVVIENRYEPMVVDREETAKPNMATSSKQIGSSTAWAAGYTGAGSKVAVIDTGIDLDHQSFSEDGFEYSLAQNAAAAGKSVEEYKASLNLLGKLDDSILSQLNIAGNSGVTADKLYQTSKIPFAYNYIDKNFTVDHDHDSQGEHGSHVEGIAAANAYIPNGDGTFSKALDAVFVQGVAPDAQIVTMKVFGAGGGAYDSDYMVAIEDAVILGCDSVNLSLGSAAPGFSRVDSEYAEIMDSLTENGTVVCMSAGNSGYWAENSQHGVLFNTDVSMHAGGSPGSFTNSLGVASVDNDGQVGNYFTVGDHKVFYLDTSDSGYKNQPMTTLVGEREYVFLNGAGAESDYEGIDVTGKIVFVSRGTTSFYEKAEVAVSKGAIATVVYNNQPGVIRMDLSDYTKTAPAVSITQADGAAVKAASTPVEDGKYYTGKLTITAEPGVGQNNSKFYTMSEFSSWGVPGSLQIKPEITAPGGSIYSVNGAVAGGKAYESMSGTSMASPQAAGMAAVVGQYIRENNLTEKTGLTARQLINSLLMSTAEPVIEADTELPYSILNQGAGLANVGNAVSAESYILVDDNLSGTASDGKVKAEFGDDPEKTGVYEFGFTIHNLTGEPQEYTFSTDLLTQAVANDEAGQLYMLPQTMALAGNVSYDVNGKTFVPTSKVKCDVDRDGDTDADDAQCILEYVVGNTDGSAYDMEAADLNDDGVVNSYDAHLLLAGLTTASVEVPVTESVHVNVKIQLTDSAKKLLDSAFPNGAYVEGYVYVETANSADGAERPVHSIPFLGFYGNWSEPSMTDAGLLDQIYDKSVHSYLGLGASSGYLAIRYPGEKNNTIYTVNPYLIEGDTVEDIPYDRAAISSGSTLAQYKLSIIRNAAASVYFVKNAEGKVVYTGGVGGQTIGAYYYTNGSKWQNTAGTLNANQKVSTLGLAEGDKFTAGVALIPEYYEVDGALTKEQVVELIESGKLGEGAYFANTFTVDNTAPELLAVQKDLTTGALTVIAKDNAYVAYLGVYKGNSTSESKLLAQGLPEQTEPGQECGGTFALDDTAGEYVTIVVADYAGNETTYKVKYGGTPEDFSGRMFGFTSGTTRGEGQRWVEINPATLSKTAGMDELEAVDYEVYAAEYAGKHVFFATEDGIYVAPQDDLNSEQKVAGYASFDASVGEMVADMAFNTQNNTMYVLTNNIADVTRGTINTEATGNKLYTLDLVTGEMTKVADITVEHPTSDSASCQSLRTLAIDDNGNFYSVNSGSGSSVFLFQWTLDEVADGALTATAVSESQYLVGSGIYVTSYGAMAYDHDKDILYLAGGYGTKSSKDVDNELWVVDPVAATAAHPNTNDAQFSDHLVGLYVVPANTIALPKDAAVTSVGLNKTELTVWQGTTLTLEASVYPWLVEDKSVTWSTSDPETVSVENDGTITTLKAGNATIKATSNADSTKYAECVVTVEPLPEIKASALIYGDDNKTYWSDFTTSNTEGWSKVAEGGRYYAGALHNDELLVHSGDTMFGVDPDTFETTSYGTIASSWIWSDAAAAPAVGGAFGDLAALCMNGTYFEMINPAEGTLSYFDMSSNFADDPMATIAYAGSGTYDYVLLWYNYPNCPANFYYVMTESGELYKFTVFYIAEQDGYSALREDLGNTGLELPNVSAVTAGQYASMIFDQASSNLVLSSYQYGDTATVYVIDPETLLPAVAGTFGDKVWPAVSLYQYERATDLTLKVDPTSATIYAGDSIEISTKVVLGDTKELTWTTSNPAVATVENGVITGVAAGEATITATTVATNKAGKHVSANIAVTVKPLVSVDATVNAQVTTDAGTAWTAIDLNDMSTTTLGAATTQLYGGGYAQNYLWGTDVQDEMGGIYRIDPNNGFEESRGSDCSPDYSIRDLADSPAVTFSLTEGETVHTATTFGNPIYLSGADGVYELVDYVEGKVSGWSASSSYPDLAAITYVGDITVDAVNEKLSNPITKCDAGTTCHVYYVLGVDGTLYQFITVPIWNTTAVPGKEVSASIVRGSMGNIGLSFSDVASLSMEYVELSKDNYGLVIADATNGSIYYANLAGEPIVSGKVGSVAGATNITALYSVQAGNASTTAIEHGMAMAMTPAYDVHSNSDDKAETDDVVFAQTATIGAELRETETSVDEAETFSVEQNLVANVATGSVNAVSASANTSKSATLAASNTTVVIKDTEDMTNGKYVVTYDPAKLTFVSATSAQEHHAVKVDETAGTITFAFASDKAVAAGTVLATVQFAHSEDVNTTITITTEERNENGNVSETPVVIVVKKEEEEPAQPSRPTPTPIRDNYKLPFVDVDEKDPYYDAIKYLYENGIMNGISLTQFGPDMELQRAMLVTILYRMEGKPAVEGKHTFSDVADGQYYTEAVEWASANGIVNGFTDGTFKPTQAVSREQLAAIIYRYAQYKGVKIAEPTATLSAGASVSDWAMQNVLWALSEGILPSTMANHATANANRAEVAVAIYVYLTKTAA